MWSKPKQHNAFVITITPRTITYSHLSRPTKISLIQLKSHDIQILDTLELEKLVVFNPSIVAKQIQNHYKTLANRSLPVLIALNGSSLFAKIISSSKAHPSLNQLNVPHIPHMQWAYRYLYSHDHRHYFYVCGLPQQILLQYQLLSIKTQLPVRVISTEHMALLHLYRHLTGSMFRHSQLGTMLIERNNNIEQLFSEDDLPRVLSLPSDQKLIHENQIPLLAACGLFISEGL
jgi:hypothetical protein